MNCEQEFCIYNKKYKCILKKISINALAMCEDCILVLPDYDTLEDEKRKILKQLGD